MAGMAREDLIEYGEDYLKDLTAACCKISEKHKAFVKTAISDMERVEQLEAENKRLKEGIEKVKAVATETLIKFHEECIHVARDNLLESHVDEVGRIFAAVLIGKPYDQVTRDEVDAMLTAPEEDEDEEI